MSNGASQHEVGRDEPDRARARSAIARALGDLRRGAGVVLIDARGGEAVLVVAAEVADAAEDLFGRVGSAPCCVVPRARAAALALNVADSPAVAIPCGGAAGAPLDTVLVRAVAGAEGPGPGPTGHPAGPADALQRAAVELVKLARLLPAAITVSIPGDAARFAEQEDLLAIDADWIAAYRADAEGESVTLVTRAPVPLEGAENAEIFAFRPEDGGKEHLAIVIGEPRRDDAVLVRIHSECFTGDLLGSLRCDCGEQLRGAIQTIAADGAGVLLYLAQEGRGIGLVNKLRAYRLQDEGFDTIDANERLGFEADARAYRPAATMLRALGINRVRLLTNNPAKVKGLCACGIEVVERVPHAFPANAHNDRYLSTKAARAGHLL
ncbi:MAG: GTP cyclohydrolase II [Rhodospirillales bacterium]|nr:MAG: GTP cyclohydrolase II [Rhodospirillales bacterium]